MTMTTLFHLYFNASLYYITIVLGIYTRWYDENDDSKLYDVMTLIPVSAANHQTSCLYDTVNVDIFAQQNFRASSPMRHIRAVKFSRICCLFLFVLL